MSYASPISPFIALGPLFLTGLLYSLYHCVGMCGGFVAAYSATCSIGSKTDRDSSVRSASAAQWPMHLLFNLGRVTSYSIIGALLGFAGSWINYSTHYRVAHFQGIASIIGGTLMILFALGLVGLVRVPAGTLLGGGVVRRAFTGLLRSRSPWRTYPIGMLVGTVPCGLVYSMASYALASGSGPRGAIDMAAFGFGTVPAMFCFGYVSSAISSKFRRGLLWIAVALAIGMGIEAIRRGIGAL